MKAPLTYRCPSCDHEATVGQPCRICTKKMKSRIFRKIAVDKPKNHHSWQQDHQYDGLDLPEDADEVEADTSNRHHLRLRWYWVVTAILLLIATLLGIMR